MSRIKEITVSLDMTVQPKQYQSVKLGISVTRQFDETDAKVDENLEPEITYLRKQVSAELISGLRSEIEQVYGKATADYVVNQKGV